MSETQNRKLQHLKICTEENVEVGSNWFEYAHLVHNALPEIDLSEVDTRTKFLGRKLEAPIIVAAITGGVEEAGKINKDIASVVEKLGLGMGVGSQRAMIEKPEVTSSYQVREEAPSSLILGNVGAAQLQDYSVEKVMKAMKDIQADAMCVHINAAQEANQPEGDTNFRRVLEKINVLAENIPVIAKEVGNGISRTNAILLKQAGCKAIDVGGFGGTSWVKVDSLRGKGSESFYEWGIPTAACLFECKNTLPLIATGGIRTGQDVAKAIALDAELAGMALPVIKAYYANGKEGVEEFLKEIMHDLKITMFLVGAQNVSELKNVKPFITGPLMEWVEQRDLK